MWKAMTMYAVTATSAMVSLAAAQQQWGATVAPERAQASSTPRFEQPPPQPRPAAVNAPSDKQMRPEVEPQVSITASQIEHLKATLKLTPEQHSRWLPVEAALHELMREQRTATAGQLRRLRAIAAPLITSLDESQKRSALAFARQGGYGRLLASF
jgi:hypothetical protein